MNCIDAKNNIITYRTTDNEWNIRQVDVYYEYQKQIIMTGAAQQIDIMFSFPIKLERIEYFYSDTSQKSFSVKVFNGDFASVYTHIADLDDDYYPSVLILCNKDNLKFTQTPIIFRTDITASVINKVMTIKLYVKRLDKIAVLRSD